MNRLNPALKEFYNVSDYFFQRMLNEFALENSGILTRFRLWIRSRIWMTRGMLEQFLEEAQSD